MKSRGTVATLLRIFPYAKSALPRVILGTIAALAAHLFALTIPTFLRDVVNGLKEDGSVEKLIPAVIACSLSASPRQDSFCCAAGSC